MNTAALIDNQDRATFASVLRHHFVSKTKKRCADRPHTTPAWQRVFDRTLCSPPVIV
jgi:hypothetical protein